MYKIETKGAKHYVIPTADTVMDNFKRFEMPYDSNWEIYKLFNYSAKDFMDYVISAFNATVIIHYEFPWLEFYFSRYIDAEDFLKEINKRINNP